MPDASADDKDSDRAERMKRALDSAFAVLESGSDDLVNYIAEVRHSESAEHLKAAASDLAEKAGARLKARPTQKDNEFAIALAGLFNDAVDAFVQVGEAVTEDESLTDERERTADRLGKIARSFGDTLLNVSNAAVGNVDSGPPSRPLRQLRITLARNEQSQTFEGERVLYVVNRTGADAGSMSVVVGPLTGPNGKSLDNEAEAPEAVNVGGASRPPVTVKVRLPADAEAGTYHGIVQTVSNNSVADPDAVILLTVTIPAPEDRAQQT